MHNKYNKTILPFLLMVLLWTSKTAIAESVTFIKEYTYQASEADSKISSRTIALEQTKRLLLEELGTYLESQVEVKNYQLTKDQISILTAGIVQAEIIGEKWDGKTYQLKAKIAVDINEVAKQIDALRRDQQKVKDLEDARKRADDLIKEIEKLKSELASTKALNREPQQQRFNNAIKGLSAIDWCEKGNAFLLLGNYNAAIEAANKCIELSPKIWAAYGLRGYIYYRLENFKQALADYNQAIELAPNYDGMYDFRGGIYLRLAEDQWREELKKKALNFTNEEYERELKKPRGYPKPIADYSFFKLGMRDFDKALEINPKNTRAYMHRGNGYITIGEYQKGFNDLDRALKIDPQNFETHLSRGYAYSAIGNNKQALIEYDRVVELNPKIANGYYARGMFLADNISMAQGVSDLEKAVALDPNNSEYLTNLGMVYLGLGEEDKGINALKIAAKLGHEIARIILKSKKIDWQ